MEAETQLEDLEYQTIIWLEDIKEIEILQLVNLNSMHWLRMPNSMQQQTYRRYLPIKQWHLQVKIFWKNQAEFLAIKVMNLIVSINFHHQDQKKITQHLNYLEDHLLNAFHLQRGKDLQKENKNCRNSINSSLLSKPIKMMSRKTRPQI